MGVAGVGVGVDAPVALSDILLDRLGGVDEGRVFRQAVDVLPLHLVGVAVDHEGAHHLEVARFEELLLDHVLNIFDGGDPFGLQALQDVEKYRAVVLGVLAFESGFDRIFDFIGCEALFRSVAFENLFDDHGSFFS